MYLIFRVYICVSMNAFICNCWCMRVVSLVIVDCCLVAWEWSWREFQKLLWSGTRSRFVSLPGSCLSILIVCGFESDRGFEIWCDNFLRSICLCVVWFWNYLILNNWRIEICWMIKNWWISFRFYWWEIVFVDGIDASMSIRALGSCADSPALQMQCEIAF